MHSRLSRRFLPVWLAPALVAVSLTAPLAKAQPPGAAAVNQLTGSWKFTLYETLTPPTGQFLALATFTEDGSFIGTAQGDGQPNGPTEGPAHGVWQRASPNHFAVTFKTIWRQPDGSLFGIFTVNMTLTLDPRANQLTGTWTGKLRDPNGNVISTVGGTLTAETIQAEPEE